MKTIPWIIAGVCLVWAVLATTCSGPEPVTIDSEREMQYRRQHVIDSIKLAESDARIKSIQKTLVDTVKAVIVKSEAKDKEIRVLRSKADTRRTQVQPLIDSIPTLKAFIETQDSIIEKQDEQIADLQGGMYRVAKELSNLIGEQAVNSRVAAEMIQDCELRKEEISKDYRKLLKKERRKGRFAKVLIPIVAVLGIVGGSQL